MHPLAGGGGRIQGDSRWAGRRLPFREAPAWVGSEHRTLGCGPAPGGAVPVQRPCCVPPSLQGAAPQRRGLWGLHQARSRPPPPPRGAGLEGWGEGRGQPLCLPWMPLSQSGEGSVSPVVSCPAATLSLATYCDVVLSALSLPSPALPHPFLTPSPDPLLPSFNCLLTSSDHSNHLGT